MSLELTRRRLLAVAALLVAAGAFAFLAFGNIGENLVYYWSPTELLEAGGKARGADVRLAGLVEPGSLVRGGDGLTLDFSVTDGERSIPVRARAVPPAMFREGIGVVLEGKIGSDGVFSSSRLMVKHDNQYRAPGTPEEKSVEELIKTLQFDSRDT